MLFSPQIIVRSRFAPGSGSGGGGGGGPPLANLVIWGDASIAASLTLSGSDVTSIADQSGNGKTMSAVVHSPTYSATGFNSKPGITFNPSGGTQALQATSVGMGTGNTATIFFVGTRTAANASNYCRYLSYVGSGQSDDFNNAGSWCISGVAGTVGQIMWQRSPSNFTGSVGSGNHIVIVTVASSGATTIYVDGVSAGTGTISGNWISNGTFNVGREASSSFANLDATLAEWGVSTDFTSSTDVGTLYNNLKTKWGL